jgi:3-polyprenyl-4-hydroxybenzoate decarboxylase
VYCLHNCISISLYEFIPAVAANAMLGCIAAPQIAITAIVITAAFDIATGNHLAAIFGVCVAHVYTDLL